LSACASWRSIKIHWSIAKCRDRSWLCSIGSRPRRAAASTTLPLEEVGLLKRQPDPEDGRAIRLFVTAEGRALRRRAQAFRWQKTQRLLAGLTEEERATFLALLEKALTEAEKNS